LGNEGQVKWAPIQFESSNITMLSNDINENIWTDHNFPLAFKFLTTDDDILEYLGANFEFLKSDEKLHTSYLLNKYAYFGQEINFHNVL